MTLTRVDLQALLDEADAPAVNTRDMTIAEVAEETRRAPSTVRGWLISGELRGYKLNRRDWRVPRSALRAYLEAQRPRTERNSASQEEDVDIGAWRKLRDIR